MIEAAGFRTGKKRQRNNAHGFLRIICPMTMRHPGCAEDLQLSEQRLDKVRRETMQRYEQQKHQQPTENESGHR